MRRMNMCGILGVLGKIDAQEALAESQKLSHRGPDQSDFYQSASGAILCHERLSIMDPGHGKQPLPGPEGLHVIHNGEIYNYSELEKKYFSDRKFHSTSDSEVIPHMYEMFGPKCVDMLDGVFAFIILDEREDEVKFFVARDPIGVKPLYYGEDRENRMWFASESKSLMAHCIDIKEFPTGHYYTKETGFIKYYEPKWAQKEQKLGPEKIKDSLEAAVRKRLMSDVPLGVLLSGGLDSSLVTSIVAREMKKIGKKVMSFSVGLAKGSKDLELARKVAEFCGTDHHEVIFTPEQGYEVIKQLIWKAETYDVTTIRAATPMYIMSKYIAKQGVKVVLSGEGADEIFGGYLYFHNAPSVKDFHDECVRRVKRLHTSDVLRADRATMGASVEARVPFLDKEFLEVAMGLDAQYKFSGGKVIEKKVLREAFDDKKDPYLPDEILWRQKEQFSDGVGYTWVDTLKEIAEKIITDEEFASSEILYPHNTPSTKEAYMYRKIFSELFTHKDSDRLVHKWLPRWQEYDLDPSGRANAVHKVSYHEVDKVKDYEAKSGKEDLSLKEDHYDYSKAL